MLANSESANGVYKYGSSSAFPTETYQASNNWVDVVFEKEAVAPPPPYNVNPSVTLTSPAYNAKYRVGKNMTMAATAADSDGTVSLVEFYSGSTLLGSDTSSPYTYTWASVPEGTYQLTAKAYENDGGTAESAAVSVQVIARPVVRDTRVKLNQATRSLEVSLVPDGTGIRIYTLYGRLVKSITDEKVTGELGGT